MLTKTKTQVIKEDQRIGWEVYQDLLQVTCSMSNTELLTLAKEALNPMVSMAAVDELARRRPNNDIRKW